MLGFMVWRMRSVTFGVQFRNVFTRSLLRTLGPSLTGRRGNYFRVWRVNADPRELLSIKTDVIFVSEKCGPKSKEIAVDKAKRLALQRDIDQQSQPRQLAKPLTSQGSVPVERPVGRMKMEEEKSEQIFIKKKKKKPTKGQVSLPEMKHVTVDDGSIAEVKKEKKKGKKDDVIDIDGESLDGSGEPNEKKKKKKRKIDAESLNGSCVKKGNDKEVSKKKKQLETAQLSSVKEVEEKQKKVKNVKNKSVQIKPQNVKQEEEQQAEKDELPKKAKKRKHILVVTTEKNEEQVKEKKKKKKKKTTDEETTEGRITKKKKSAKMKVTENGVKLGTPEGETCGVEEVKVKKKNKKGANAKEDENKLATPLIKGNSKKSKAASGQKVEKDDMPNKKNKKSTKREIIIIDKEEPELKTNGKKGKGRKASEEVSEVEEKEPKKKKKGNSKGGEEEPSKLKCEEVAEQISETVAGDTTSKKSKKKKNSTKMEIKETVSFGTVAKKRKIKEEVEDQHESPHKDVVFLSEKTGNTDEVTINQERRQALQVEIDKASQPHKPNRPTGLGQWGTAQFDSSDQQQKFLRLMGGFKKGSQLAVGSSGGANTALGKDAQQQLQQGLLGEFERAQSRRMDFSNRGSGLGFSAPANKKFSIDINASRSVRFDD